MSGFVANELSAFDDQEKATLPNSLNDIGRGNLLDPWARHYNYLIIANDPGAALTGIVTLPYNADFDLYSLGVDGATNIAFGADEAKDDILRASDGGYVGIRDF
ncbi:MAG: hypothetical protein WA140_01385 [Geobacteraceae bacterium]